MKLSDFLEGVGRPVAYYPGMARMLGDMKEAVFLCQMAYWKDKGGAPEGWIYKTSEQIEEETALSYKEQIGVRAGLTRKNLLEERYERTEHQMYFRVNWDAVNELWAKYIEMEHMTKGHMPKCQVPPEHLPKGHVPPAVLSPGILPIGISLNGITEITSETTIEERVWGVVSSHLESEMKKDRFLLTVKGATPLSCLNGVLVVEEPTMEAMEWAKSRLTSTIERLLVGILDIDKPTVKFVVREEVPA